MTVIERESILIDAARRYLAGEISYEEMTEIRRRVDAPGFIGWDVRAVQRAWFQWGRERGYTQATETDLDEN